MSDRYLLFLIALTAVATYLLRAIPLVLLRRPIRNRFLQALLEVLPYGLLAAMVFPDIFYGADSGGAGFPSMPGIPSLAGGLVAVVLGIAGCNLPLVAAAATLVATGLIFLGLG